MQIWQLSSFLDTHSPFWSQPLVNQQLDNLITFDNKQISDNHLGNVISESIGVRAGPIFSHGIHPTSQSGIRTGANAYYKAVEML